METGAETGVATRVGTGAETGIGTGFDTGDGTKTEGRRWVVSERETEIGPGTIDTRTGIEVRYFDSILSK